MGWVGNMQYDHVGHHMTESFDKNMFQSDVAQIIQALDASYRRQMSAATATLQQQFDRLFDRHEELKALVATQAKTIQAHEQHIQILTSRLELLESLGEQLRPTHDATHTPDQSTPSQTSTTAAVSPVGEHAITLTETDTTPSIKHASNAILIDQFLATDGMKKLSQFLQKSNKLKKSMEDEKHLQRVRELYAGLHAAVQPASYFLAITVSCLLQTKLLDDHRAQANDELCRLLLLPQENGRFLDDTANITLTRDKKIFSFTLFDFLPKDVITARFGPSHVPFLAHFTDVKAELKQLSDAHERVAGNLKSTDVTRDWDLVLKRAFDQLDSAPQS